MATIIEIDELEKRREDEQKTCPPIDKNIMEQIMVDPMGCLNDDEFMLTYVVNNGINCSLLCEAMGVHQLHIMIDGEEYKMFYSKPHPMFEHSDVVFNTPLFKRYKKGQFSIKQKIEQILDEALPTGGDKSNLSPIFREV